MAPVAATAGELAAAQAAYDTDERNGARGDRFFQLTFHLATQGRGVMTEQQVVQRLGTPDGYWQSGDRATLVYNYDRFGKKDWAAVADFKAGILQNFGYTTSSAYPSSVLQPYPAPPTTTAPVSYDSSAPR